MNSADLLKAKNLSSQVKGLGLSPKPVQAVRAYYSEVAPSSDKLQSIIEPLVKHHVGLLQAPELEITPEMVKKIVQAMHNLPEVDKLEVSKGIRNASSFIYNGTKYGTHEMMHGGSASSSSGGFQQPTGTVDGSNTVFTWTTAPQVIVVDQGRPMQKTSSDGTVNWTGTTTTTLTIAPNFDIYAVT